jgi:hypothetical protein
MFSVENMGDAGILASQEVEIRRIEVQSQLRQIVCETLSKKKHPSQKTKLVEWLKLKILSSSPKPQKKLDDVKISLTKVIWDPYENFENLN